MSGRKYYKDPVQERNTRRPFKVWLRDRLTKSINKNMPGADIGIVSMENSSSYPGRHVFNKSFEGWSLRLHKAVDGHVVEAWKSCEDRAVPSNYKPPHELFMVRDDQDMAAALNDILIQLMLRG